MSFLLDTNIVSELVAKIPNRSAVDFISSLDEEKLFLSVITIGEIVTGIENISDKEKKEKLLHWLENDLLERFQNRILDIDIYIMTTWGKINQKLKTKGQPLPIMDSLIGATCQTKNLTLITRNEKDFQNLDIKIINPFNPF